MKNPVPFRYRWRYAGCLPNPPDYRDLVLGDVPFERDPATPSWEEGFDLEEKYGRLKREHQGSSKSCVGQGWAKYAEMLNLIETGEFTDLSARYIYSQIYLPEGGAFIRDGAKIVVNQGVAEERLVPSYIDHSRPTEDFMRRKDGVEEAKPNAKIYKAKKFVWLPAHDIVDDMRYVIYSYGGFVSGYRYHCMYACGYGMRNGKRAIKFVNSYGDNSDHWYLEGSGYPLYNITFLIDLPNDWFNPKINMLKLLQEEGREEIYAVLDGKNIWISTPELFEAGKKEGLWGDWKDVVIVKDRLKADYVLK